MREVSSIRDTCEGSDCKLGQIECSDIKVSYKGLISWYEPSEPTRTEPVCRNDSPPQGSTTLELPTVQDRQSQYRCIEERQWEISETRHMTAPIQRDNLTNHSDELQDQINQEVEEVLKLIEEIREDRRRIEESRSARRKRGSIVY